MKTNSRIALVAAGTLLAAPNSLSAAYFPPWFPGSGGLAEIGRAFSPAPPARPAPPDLARPLLDKYVKIHNALAQDSLQGVAESAAAIAKAVRSDPGRTLPQRIAREADRLAEAKDLAAARHAFIRVSPHLINYVKKNHLPGFYMGYCRMEKVAWLQADSTPANPYMGKAMPGCAWFRELKG